MYRNKGRPHKVQSEDFVNSVVAYKDRVILSGKMISKNDTIWCDIATSLGDKIKSTSIYAMVTNNVHGVRDKLLGRLQDASTDTVNTSNTSLNSSASRYEENIEPLNFVITVSNNEFNELIVFKSYKRAQGKKMRHRNWKTLRPGLWEDFITKKIWNTVKLKCGFRFRNHYLSNDGTSGYINGKFIKFVIIVRIFK